MNVSVIVATHGDQAWEELAWSRAYPSARGQGALEVLVVHDSGGTVSGVRNAVAAEAKGLWLCFLDADDELAPGYLEAMAAAWAEHAGPGETVRTNSGPRPTRHPPLADPALLVPAVQYVDPLGYESKPQVLNDGRPLHEINCAVVGTLVPRDLFLEVGGFPEEPVYEDWALWLACERAGARLVDVPEAVYRAHTLNTFAGSRNRGKAHKVYSEVYWRLRRQHEAWLRERAAA